MLEQLSELEEITYRAMMGEYIIYYRGKIVGGIYDDRLLVKPVKSAIALMPNATNELPYEGAKEMLLVDNVDSKEFLPMVVIILGAFKEHKEFLSTGVFELPEKLYLGNFREAFYKGDVSLGFKNTFIILIVSCIGTVLTGTMTAFVVQRFDSLLSRTVKAAFLVATLLPNISMQVTVFQIVDKIGVYDSIWAPIILYVGTDIISIYIFIQFLSQISTSLDESAIVDGASYPRIYFSIILPLLRPAIATVLIIKMVGIYNDFYTANLYMPSNDLPVISTVLYRFIGPYGAKWEIIMAGIIIAILPTLIIFLCLQKYIYSGLVSGSVKE